MLAQVRNLTLLVACVVLASCDHSSELDVRYVDEHRQFFSTVAVVDADHLAVAGISSARTPGTTPSTWDAVVAVYGTDGAPSYIHTIASPGLDQFTDIEPLPDGSVIAAGSFSASFQIEDRAVMHSGTGTNGVVMALSPTGSLRWFRTFAGAGDVAAYRLVPTRNGMLISLEVQPGQLTTTDGTKERTIVIENHESVALMEVSLTNQVLRTQVLPIIGTAYDLRALDDGFVVGGVFSGHIPLEDGAIAADNDGNDGFVLYLDETLVPYKALHIEGSELTPVVSLTPLGSEADKLAVAGHFHNELSIAGTTLVSTASTRATFVVVLDAQMTVEHTIVLNAPNFVSPYEVVAVPASAAFDVVGVFHDRVQAQDTIVHATDSADGFVLHMAPDGEFSLRSSTRTGFDAYFAATRAENGTLTCAGQIANIPHSLTPDDARPVSDGWIHAPC